LIAGITRGTTRAHIARATLEAIVLQVDDVLRAMGSDLGAAVARMRVDGGAAANDLLLEFRGNFSALLVERPTELESTARGAAMLAGVGSRFPHFRRRSQALPSRSRVSSRDRGS
jgi:glycerol kinase